MWKRLSDEEHGIAMITVMLAMSVILTISVAAYQLSVANLYHSSFDRKRDQALQAAQAAVNSYVAALPSTTAVCTGVGTTPTTSTLSATPYVTYSAQVWWSTDGTTFNFCSTAPTGATLKSLKYLVVTGTGLAGRGVAIATRKWQTLVTVTPINGGTTSAFYGNTGLCLRNNPNLLHNVTGNDAMLYSGGDINTTATCGNITLNASAVIEGSVYAQGSIANLFGCIEGNIWAGGSIQVQNMQVGACTSGTYPSGTAITANSPPNPTCNGQNNNLCYFADSSGNPYGSVTAAGGTLNMSGVFAYGTCKSSGIQTWTSGSECSPNKDASLFSPVTCAGSPGDGSANCGTGSMTGLSAPPITVMPTFLYTCSDWGSPCDATGTPYAIVNETSGDCATTIPNDIISKIGSGVNGDYDIVFYINPACNLVMPNNSVLSLKGNTIIVTKGSYSSSGITVSTAAGSACTTSNATDLSGNAMYPNHRCQFDIIVPSDVVVTPTSSCVPPAVDPGTWDISFGQNTDMSGVDGFNYTPCQVTLGQSATLNGQSIAGVVNEANHFTMSYYPLKVPGFIPTGYNAAPSYFRECVAGSVSGGITC
jgi:Tfp pilus assembly protein PilX